MFLLKRQSVHYPYTNKVVGYVPAGTTEHARKTFEIAASCTPKITRNERNQILQRAGELIWEKREFLAKWLTLELGICHQHAIYEIRRAGCLPIRRCRGAER
ncbi:succinic semialdehyde dehydrogenase [Ruegeria meonggei]|uniref:Succinic semialdehyde dehydrogenase n=1 Tax=Ruegeria meonggei TaxID=1446476 RepID=A0A1X6Z289_9RHOB|nr:succinic semialdehyde dehydrogenase [Ruegeria meonggei]